MKRISLMTVFVVLVPCTLVAGALAANKRPTCGQMTARFASQPEAIASLLAATADHLEAHAAIVGLSGTKEAAVETAGLAKIVGHLRKAADEVGHAASEMRAAANWPEAPHDVTKMRADAKMAAARDRKIAALGQVAAEVQKEVDFWQTIPVTKK